MKLMDNVKLKEIISEEIKKQYNIGESAGGSGHLSFVSITQIDIEQEMKIEFNNSDALEVIFSFKTYRESEFLHDDPEMEMYNTRTYHDSLIINEKFEVLKYKKG